MEANQLGQVVVTSHSPDLLDREDIPEDAIEAVAMCDGCTIIGRVNNLGRLALTEHLYTAGELVRMDQLQPEGIPDCADVRKRRSFCFRDRRQGERWRQSPSLFAVSATNQRSIRDFCGEDRAARQNSEIKIRTPRRIGTRYPTRPEYQPVGWPGFVVLERHHPQIHRQLVSLIESAIRR
jgi:hypothetical protein